MNTRWLSLAAAVALGLPLLALGLDAPHDASMSTGSCLACHQLHNATGGSLTNRPAQADLCRACHNAPGKGARTNWADADQSVPGTSGDQHRWDAAAVNAAHGATAPLDPGMALRVTNGNISCSTCHDIHKANANYAASTVHSNYAFGVPQPNSAGSAGATLTLQVQESPRPIARGYRVKAVAGNGIILSHDAGLGAAATWLNWNGTAWVTGVDMGPGRPIGGAVVLDDPSVSVTFTGTAASGDTWDFYVGYPFLRADNTAGAICLQCHADRNQSHYEVEGGAPGFGWGVGAVPYSHPVGQSLNANLRSYDRGAPLDANGAAQGAAGVDGNPTNDLVLTSGANQVSCVTCHAPHNTDSNSLTVDP